MTSFLGSVKYFTSDGSRGGWASQVRRGTMGKISEKKLCGVLGGYVELTFVVVVVVVNKYVLVYCRCILVYVNGAMDVGYVSDVDVLGLVDLDIFVVIRFVVCNVVPSNTIFLQK